MFLLRIGVAGLLIGAPALGWAQAGTFPSIPRYYVGVAAYSSDYQRLGGSAYSGTCLPVQATLGYQLGPRLAVQLSGAASSVTSLYSATYSYYASPSGTSNYKTVSSLFNSSRHNTSLALLGRYTLTRQLSHRFQVDALGGLTLEIQRYTEHSLRTESDSTGAQTATVQNDYQSRSNDLLLSLGISPRFRFNRHLEALLDVVLNRNVSGTGRGLTGATALGVRYRFGY